MRIASYVRPWSINYFRYVLPKIFPDASTKFISDFRGLGDFSWSEIFKEYYRKGDEAYQLPPWLTAHVEFEIIARDRLLRNLPYLEASRMVRAMCGSIKYMLESLKLDAIISPIADNYVMELLVRHCRHNSIPYCGLVSSPIPNSTRCTALGEVNSFRNVSHQECDEAREFLADKEFRPPDLIEWLDYYGNSNIAVKRALREIPKRYTFPLIGFLRRDSKNYHYMSSGMSRISFFRQALFLKSQMDSDWYIKLQQWPGNKIYLPLQAYPEATTDYHVGQIDLIDFPRLLPRLLSILCADKDLLVCVKEHPGMMGVRPPHFYTPLKKHNNLLLVPPQVPASTLIEDTDLTLTWTGTGGLEAAIRGKPVITIGSPFYNIGGIFENIANIEQLNAVRDLVYKQIGKQSSKDETLAIAKHVLSSSFPGEFHFINFDENNDFMRRHADDLALGIKSYWSAWCNHERRKNMETL